MTLLMVILIGKRSVAGIFIGGMIAFGFGKLYEHLIRSVEGDSFGLSLSGLFGSVLFVLLVSVMVMGMTGSFMKHVNLIEILNEERRTEPVRNDADRKYLVTGLILIVLGILGGLMIPFVISAVFKMTLRGFAYAFYILVLIGMYRIMVYSVAVHKRGENPQKYYRNLISWNVEISGSIRCTQHADCHVSSGRSLICGILFCNELYSGGDDCRRRG